MSNLLQDVRYAMRMLTKSPVFALVAVMTLALGIGANSVIFTMLKGVLLRPLPGVPDGEEIRCLLTMSSSGEPWPLTYPDYRDFRDRNQVFSTLAASMQNPMSVRIGTAPAQRVWGEAVSGNWFEMLRAETVLGRPLNPEDDRASASAAVVITYGFWQREFGGRSDVIGQPITIGSKVFTIVGVTAPPFRGSVNALALELFVPLQTYQDPREYRARLESRNDHGFIVQGRLKPGITLEQASASIAVLSRQIQAENKPTEIRQLAVLVPLWKFPFGGQKILLPVYSILMIVAGIVLLISCANVANLLLARATGRQREIAVRRALGASRGRLIQQLLTESVLLSFAGGIAGMLAGLWYGDGFSKINIPTPFPAVLDVRFDWLVFGFTFAVSLLSGIVFGLAPAVQTSAANMSLALRVGSTTGGSARSRLRSLLVVAQIAAACILLIGAGLAGKSFENAQTLNPGFDVQNVALASVELKAAGYNQSTAPAFYQKLSERLAAQPGVESAGIATFLPLMVVGAPSRSVEVEGYVPRPEESTSFYFNLISPGYFSTMRIPVTRGRDFEWRDDADHADVAIVSESFVRRYFGNRDPLGRKIRTNESWREIVGVAKDIHYLTLTETPLPLVYLPLHQNVGWDITVHVKSAQDPAVLFPLIQKVVKELDPALPVYKSRT
ncbi:MAG: ABC transporter permease, partial [Acidobacteria bacterium]|nr:ABC transporter permease [Acidobacteriota bacterium]